MDGISVNLIEKCLGYHGVPLQKIWEGEHGENSLSAIGLKRPDFSVYSRRQKLLAFHDRAKRLKLHQFISKKANQLFHHSMDKVLVPPINKDVKSSAFTAELPPYELFCHPLDPNKRVEYFFHSIQPGDVIYGMVTAKTTQGLSVKVYYSTGTSSKYVADLTIRAFIPVLYLIPAVDKRNVAKGYNINDLVCCEVVEIVPDTGKLICGMQGAKSTSDYLTIPLGLIGPENFPEIFKLYESRRNASYEEFLESLPGFSNPNIEECLYKELGLDFSHHYTNMSSLRGRFPQQEYSNELRQVQASKWAFRSVAEGIEHFKEGRHAEAFQCLNKALNIDPRNVEGLVARGALYANSGSFKKAVEDFETALRLNRSHANARKYMGETLVALGRSYEDENKIEDARKAYQDCLNIIPHHEEAQHSLEFLKNKTTTKQIVEPAELELPAIDMAKSSNDKLERENSLSKKDDSRKEKKNKKEKRKKNRKRKSSTSDSSSDSSDSSDSSSESTSSSTTSSSTGSDSNSRNKKKRRSRSEKLRQKSLSPLSKRMTMGEPSSTGDSHYANQSYHNMEPPVDDYETKVRKFLEMPRDQENYEEKVRRFVAEASKYQKERKNVDEKSKKKKRRDDRKAKKESKKKRKRDERKKSKSKKDRPELDETKTIREALKIFENLPVLDELGTKLSEYYSKVDKNEDEETNNKSVKPATEKIVSLYDKEDDNAISKWKMKFSKDDRSKDVYLPGNSKSNPKQYAFGNESDESDEQKGYNMQGQQYPPPAPSMTSNTSFEKNKRRPASPPSPPPPPPSSSKSKDHMPQSQVKSGPIVLDKFGNFRLASMDAQKPPEPPGTLRERSNSKPRRKYNSSSSRSKSRSPRRRSRSGSYVGRKYTRSRSHSYNRRSGSRTRSRSYSRSHSRSRSPDRNRRYDRRTYRGRGGNYNDRGTYYKPRFNNSRGRGRGGNSGPSNYRDYREYRGRGRPYRPRPRGGNGGPRYNRYRDDSRERRRDSRSRSFSEERPRSPNEEREWSDNERPRNNDKSDDRKEKVSKDSDKRDSESRWADNSATPSSAAPVGTDHSLEEIEKFLEKTRKEKKEDMIERNKDMVKKNNW